MGVFLKHKDQDIYIKSVSWVDGKVEFCDSTENAKRYKSDWFADAEKQQLQHYCEIPYEEGGLEGDHKDVIKELSIYFT